MPYYAQLRDGICIAVSQVAGTLAGPDVVEIAADDTDLLWRKYKDGAWSAERYPPSSRVQAWHARIDANSVVSEVFYGYGGDDAVQLQGVDEAAVGDIYDPSSGTFSPPPAEPPPPTLTITLDATVVPVTSTVHAAVEVRDDAGLVPVDGTYYVPVVGVDGRQDRLLTVVVQGGQGAASWTPTSPGIYTVRTGLIRPRPTAQLAAAPELIVTE